MMCDVNTLKGFEAYLTRRLMDSAGDQTVTHTIGTDQFPKLINQVMTTLLPVMIRLPDEECKLREWLTEWLSRVRSGIG